MTRVHPKPAVLLVALATLAGCEGAAGPTGPEGPTGPQGPAGPGTDASISSVSPRTLFLDRSVDVLVSGTGTDWTSGVTVDFGADVVATTPTVASPTALVVGVTPALGAATGPRDLRVAQGVDTLVFADGVEVVSPLELGNVVGTLAQGSVVQVQLRQRDASTPFDARTTGNGYTKPITYDFLAVEAEGQSAPGRVDEAIESSVWATLFLDAAGGSGPTTLTVESGEGGDMVTSTLPGGLEVAARSPVMVAPGGAETRTLADSLGTLLFATTASAGQLVTAEIEASSDSARTYVYHLPESGRFADRFLGESLTMHVLAGAADTTHHFVYHGFDPGGYDVTLTARSYTPGAEAEPNDAAGSANALTGGILGAVGTAGDVDVFAVSALTGQTIVVSSGSGVNDACPVVDTGLDILDTDGTTVLASEDYDYCDRLSTTVGADGTYFVRLTASPGFCPDCTFDYSLVIDVR